MPRSQPKNHTADEFDLDVLSSDMDIFRWFLLCYLFGKPIRSETAAEAAWCWTEGGRDIYQGNRRILCS